ncbi:hypothetical protein DJ68_17280 [Halorubrum sp. C3]|nr:hypothetical protein DJ68_17280 [Halorubrum sp. C3]
MLPEWVPSAEEYCQFIFRAHQESTNAISVGEGGSGVHVGILDSAQTLPGTEDASTPIEHERSFIESDEYLTTPHATRVYDLIQQYAPYTTVSLYQVIDSNGDLGVGPYHDAIDAAISDGVDILNVSIGDSWDVPVYAHPLYKKTQEAIDAGITIVAAAGNDETEQGELPVHVPAVVGDVIAVNGFVTHCPQSKSDIHDRPNSGPYYLDIETDSVSQLADGVFCGYNGCDGSSCLSKQTDASWWANPRAKNGKPDVAAPVIYPDTTEDTLDFLEGSSYAAPIVTGILAEAFGEIKGQATSLPDPADVRDMVRETSSPIRESQIRKINGYKVHEQISRMCEGDETRLSH